MMQNVEYIDIKHEWEQTEIKRQDWQRKNLENDWHFPELYVAYKWNVRYKILNRQWNWGGGSEVSRNIIGLMRSDKIFWNGRLGKTAK
jgi:hypothetical protein